ncbi:universal stress protein [Streptomyces sp. NBC_01803]|uniref:universal stress protein n=1 Tax=Streptomyces sp. NBC_01803 TaxID=2975946 RepID=UPI002DD80FFF|nr:universal stress protein [Streptomyces sp. NBC_01803]WSA47340.1 universal stress protein [Streptomyces sp. NBC_01803]
MNPTVVAGLDHTPESRAAALWAADEAARRDLPLRLVHVREIAPYTLNSLSGTGELAHGPEHLLKRVADELKAVHPGLTVITDVVPGLPEAALARSAGDAGLLVLGSRALGPVTGYLVGSIALAVVARARRPVVLVRAPGHDGARHDDGDVVLGVDITHPCDDLFAFAFEAAALRGTILRVIHGYDLPSVESFAMVPDPDRYTAVATARGRALGDALRPWQHRYPEVKVTEDIVVGGAARHLTEAATTAALLVVGRRRPRTPLGPRIGSVTHTVLHHGLAPVAVVPHD